LLVYIQLHTVSRGTSPTLGATATSVPSSPASELLAINNNQTLQTTNYVQLVLSVVWLTDSLK